jgi:hypothetical protein
LVLSGCATVRSEDLAAWRGRPVANLDWHPVFAAMRVTKTHAADGAEMRNYANRHARTNCSGCAIVHSAAPGIAKVTCSPPQGQDDRLTMSGWSTWRT